MKKILIFLGLLLFILFYPKPTFAETIHSFDTHITAHKNGLMDITETINYDFENISRHGIYRYIPIFTKVGDLYRIYKIKNVKILRDGSPENFTTSQNDQNISFKIGNADKTITGDHVYKISYTVENGIGSNYADHDEIYWNTTGNDWEVTIFKATATVDTDFNAKLTKFICFEGPIGSKDTSCKIFKNTATSFQTYYSGYGLSVVAVYPVNTFPKSILSKTPPQTIGEQIANLIASNYLLIFILINFGLGGYLIYWYEKHKNKKRFGPPAVNFEIPKDEKGKRLAPALAGTIDSAKMERDDVTATIFDLAIRKYIKLEEKKVVKKLSPDKKTQTITKLKEADESLETFEQALMDRFFLLSDSIDVSDLKSDFYLTYDEMETSIFALLVKKGYYIKNPKTQRSLLMVAAFFALFTFNFILAGILFWLSLKLIGRTPLGDEIDFKIDGLKLFLKSMDRNYNWQAEKFYTVEQMIPYAMALGYIDQFMEQLKIIKPDYNPSWYGGYSGNFYGAYAGFYAATSSNITTAAPSSSGSGGGGFSGGGGGGGGGGSW